MVQRENIVSVITRPILEISTWNFTEQLSIMSWHGLYSGHVCTSNVLSLVLRDWCEVSHTCSVQWDDELSIQYRLYFDYTSNVTHLYLNGSSKVYVTHIAINDPRWQFRAVGVPQILLKEMSSGCTQQVDMFLHCLGHYFIKFSFSNNMVGTGENSTKLHACNLLPPLQCSVCWNGMPCAPISSLTQRSMSQSWLGCQSSQVHCVQESHTHNLYCSRLLYEANGGDISKRHIHISTVLDIEGDCMFMLSPYYD